MKGGRRVCVCPVWWSRESIMTSLRQTPLTCSGHTRPVVFLAFSAINEEGQYYSISACKGIKKRSDGFFVVSLSVKFSHGLEMVGQWSSSVQSATVLSNRERNHGTRPSRLKIYVLFKLVFRKIEIFVCLPVTYYRCRAVRYYFFK